MDDDQLGFGYQPRRRTFVFIERETPTGQLLIRLRIEKIRLILASTSIPHPKLSRAPLGATLCSRLAYAKKPKPALGGLWHQWVPDNDLLSHGQSVLSSACRRFTVLFGMGRGGSSGL